MCQLSPDELRYWDPDFTSGLWARFLFYFLRRDHGRICYYTLPYFKEISTERNYSDEITPEIDSGAEQILASMHKVAKEILKKCSDASDALVQELTEKETIERMLLTH